MEPMKSLEKVGNRNWNWPEIQRRAVGLESKLLSWMSLQSYYNSVKCIKEKVTNTFF